MPRYPTNLYYNVANRADQLDEYNFIYTPDDPATPAVEGACVNSATNTCRTAPATWTDYMESEVGIMLGHVYGNDPRPHYFHQTNIAQYDPNAADTNTATGGTLYAVVNTLLNRYEASIDRAKAPLVQLSQDEVARTLLRQNAWKSAQAGRHRVHPGRRGAHRRAGRDRRCRSPARRPARTTRAAAPAGPPWTAPSSCSRRRIPATRRRRPSPAPWPPAPR